MINCEESLHILKEIKLDLRAERIKQEFLHSARKMSCVGNAVTIFGSARLTPNDEAYQTAHDLGLLLAEHDIAVITGGGPGAMEAANIGALGGGGTSIGLSINLPFEQSKPKNVNLMIDFDKFYLRKIALVEHSMAFICMQGGYGTLEELTEVLTLQQCKKSITTPIILVGSEYWRGFVDWLRDKVAGGGMISKDDVERIIIMDDAQDVVNYILRNYE